MVFSAYREKDLEAWNRWQDSRSDADLFALYRQTDGVLQKEIGRWSGVLARPVLETEARRIARKAFEDYDPNKGVALATYLTSALQKLSRITYKAQNPVYIPEHQILKISTFDNAVRSLNDKLGRDPSTSELADHLYWSPREVTRLQKQKRTEFIASGDLSGQMFGEASDDGMLDFVYHDLTTTQKVIFEHLTGYGGKQVLSNAEIQRKLGLTPGMFSYEKKKVIEKVEQALGR